MAFLYRNSQGVAKTRHSYSAGLDFDSNPYKYYLKRVAGWRESDLKAAFKFGRAIEEAMQYFHDYPGESAGADFQKRWLLVKDMPEIQYTVKEKNWENLYKVGSDMLRLYEIRQPSLPIPLGGSSVFQREYENELYPGDGNFAGITMFGKIDIVAYTDPAHPLLTKIDWKPEYGMLRPLIIDVKTAGVNYHERPGSAAYDPQLRLYSWLSGIRDVALLWMTKTGTKMEKGASVTCLEDVGMQFKAGSEAVIALLNGDSCWIVKDDYALEEMENVQGRKPDGKLDQTVGAKQRVRNWCLVNASYTFKSALTRQRLQFNSGYVSQESAEDAGRLAGDQVQRIVTAWKSNNWVKRFNNRPGFGYFKDPYFQAFIENDTAFREQYFKKTDEDFDDLFLDEAEVEVCD